MEYCTRSADRCLWVKRSHSINQNHNTVRLKQRRQEHHLEIKQGGKLIACVVQEINDQDRLMKNETSSACSCIHNESRGFSSKAWWDIVNTTYNYKWKCTKSKDHCEFINIPMSKLSLQPQNGNTAEVWWILVVERLVLPAPILLVV